MAKTHLIQFYCILSLIFLTSIICSEVSFCDQTLFAELCNSIIGPKFESRDSSIKVSMSKTREALGHILATPHDFDAQAKTSLMDCFELYGDVINYLNRSPSHVNLPDVKKGLSANVVNHQTCLNGFKDPNFSKLFVDILAGYKPLASHLSITTEGEATTQSHFVVAQDGFGDFRTITEAINAFENQRIGNDKFIIYVKAGIYNENVIIKRTMSNLMLFGDGIDATVITNDKSIDDNLLTSDTATVQVWGEGFIATGITFENTAGPEKHQAIALLSGSDRSVFYQCSFKGYQDTLCLLENLQFFRECDIYGTIDFIFGDASAVLQNCNIYVRTPLPGQQNTITAQGRNDPTSDTGFIIHKSRVIPSPDSTLIDGLVKTFLGRPWRDYSRVVFAKCDLDIVIDSAGWLPFRGNSTYDGVYYAEYMNEGKGADTSGRISWPGYHVLTTDEEAEQFSVTNFLLGESWIPETGLPFTPVI